MFKINFTSLDSDPICAQSCGQTTARQILQLFAKNLILEQTAFRGPIKRTDCFFLFLILSHKSFINLINYFIFIFLRISISYLLVSLRQICLFTLNDYLLNSYMDLCLSISSLYIILSLTRYNSLSFFFFFVFFCSVFSIYFIFI